MPNIRIKDIPTTASATVNGDFFAVDSSASTRKLDAFNPTIGGILTVNGTGTSVFAGNANTALHVGAAAPYQRAAIGATRRLNYGDVLFSRNLQGQAGTDAYTTIGTDVGSGYAGFEAQYGGTARILVGTGSTTANAVVTPTVGLSVSTTEVATPLNTQIGGTPLITPASIDRYLSVNVTALADNPALALSVSDGTKNARGSMYIDASTTQERMAWDFTYSSAQFPALEWRIAGNVHATLRNNGSLILSGTGTDSNNGRLQLATHTTTAGGIGFGSDISLSRSAGDALDFTVATGGPTFRFMNGAVYRGYVGTNGPTTVLNSQSGDIQLQTSNAIALHLASNQNATFMKDVILGTSGPSVPSTLSGRAPRQGLVFDGTAGVSANATIAALGTSPLTYEAVFYVPLTAGVGQGVMYVGTASNSVAGNSGAVYLEASGTLRVIFRTDNSNYSIADIASFQQNNAGKFVHFALVRPSSGNPTVYINGTGQSPVYSVTGAPAGGWQMNLTGTNAVLNLTDGSATAGTTILSPRIYNRALSAAEVKALYENGAPAAADYNTAGTTINTANFGNLDGASTLTGNSATGVTVSRAVGASYIGVNAGGKSPRPGQRFRLTGTLTLNAGKVAIPSAYVDGTVATLVPLTVGAFSIEVVTGPNGGTTAGVVLSATGDQNWTISNFLAISLGAVLAPDATQTGSGLTWYDTSGNGANITLPASGVAWNVPFNGRIQFTDGTTAAPSLTFSSAPTTGFFRLSSTQIGCTFAGALAGYIWAPSANTIRFAGNSQGYFEAASAGALNIVAAGTDQSVLLSASGQGAVVTQATNTIFRSQSGASEWARFNNSGTFLLGTATDSSNGRLQLATHTAATGGIGFGADVTLYRSAADTLRTDDAFIIQRDINQEFFGFNVANANTGTSALVTASVSNGAYGAGFTMGGQNFTNTSFLRGNRLALTGPFDINYVSAQHFFWIGGGGAGTSTAGSQLVFSLGLGAKITHSPISFSTSSWLTNGAIAEFSGSTVTNNSTAASGTAASAVAYSFAVPSFAATNASVTTTNAATLYVAGNPTASTNQTFTNAWGIWNAGRTKLGGFVRIDDSSTSSSKDTGCLVVEGGIGVEENVNVGGFYGLVDGVTAPATGAGYARIYIDSADGDLKIKFSDGTVKTIVTDT